MLKVYAWFLVWYLPFYALLYVTFSPQALQDLHFGWVSFIFLIANFLDAHSTSVGLRALGSLEGEQNPIARKFIRRFGLWGWALLLKLPIVILLTLVCYRSWAAKLPILAVSGALVATAISNYRIAYQAKARKACSL